MGGQVTVALGIGLYFLCLLVIGLFLPTEGAHFCGKIQTASKWNSRLTSLQQGEPVKRAAAVPWEILFFKTKADLSTHYGPLLHRVVKKCHPHIQPILLGCLNKLQK